MAVWNTVRDMFLLARAGFVMARAGALDGLDHLKLPPSAVLAIKVGKMLSSSGAGSRAGQLSYALHQLGPSYVKLGQFLATRRDVVGSRLADDLASLQDSAPPFEHAIALQQLTASFDAPLDTLFQKIQPCVAAASIAQVHQAITTDGDVVAVKILRPGIAQKFAHDLQTFRTAARFFEKFSEDGERLRPLDVVDTLEQSVMLEMDLRLEAAAISEMAEKTQRDAGFRVPQVDWKRTTQNVLTLEWINGTALHDLDALKEKGHDLPKLAQLVVQTFLRHALRDGFFHADMHPGNLFVDENGVLVAVDFGIMGRLKPKERHFLAEILLGFITRNYQQVAQVHFDAGYVPVQHSVENFAQALRAIGEPLHGVPAEQISMARLLTHLFDVTHLFNMQTRPELLLLQKTMVVVEGVARQLDPQFNMWQTAEPVVRDFMTETIGLKGKLKDAASGVGGVGQLLVALPSLLTRTEKALDGLARLADGGIRFAPETIEDIHAKKRYLYLENVAAWISAIALVMLAAIELLK